ncbi:MAG: hypothetical protein V8Q17_08900 [Acutalibacteraceae bacterium]
MNKQLRNETETAIGVGKLTALLNPLTYAVMNLAVIGHFMVWRIP